MDCIFIDMNTNFSTRLAALRKEKKLSQKTAAAALGVSQALLSHYEKGIRECGLDFLKRTCEYYDVSSDYLLGLCSEKKKLDSEPAQTKPPLKEDSIVKSLRLSAAKICERSGMSQDETENCLNRLSALSAYRMVLMLADKNPEDRAWLVQALEAENLLSACVLQHNSTLKKDSSDSHIFKDEPEMLKNIIDSCECFIAERISPAKPKKSEK